MGNAAKVKVDSGKTSMIQVTYGPDDMKEQTSSGRTAPKVKSQPVYAPLFADFSARHHVLVAEPVGLEAVLRVIKDAGKIQGLIELYWLGSEPEQLDGRLIVYAFDSVAELNDALAKRLSAAVMGMRLYLAGREAFLWQVNLPAFAAGLREDEIQREACGSWSRRVYCVHCRHTMEGVVSNPVACPNCGILLEVRDHFSRALAAYIGVVINAEDPLDIPKPEEQFT